MSCSMVNLWNRITIYCMNHDKPKEMHIVQNTEKIVSPFFGCTQYFPENKADDESPCPNRLNMDDYQGLVQKFLEAVSDGQIGTDYTNYEFDYKGVRQKIHVRCLKYTDDEVRLGILNKTVFGH